MNATALGDHVVYTPRERGPHLIYVTYGGLDVPGLIFFYITTYTVTVDVNLLFMFLTFLIKTVLCF